MKRIFCFLFFCLLTFTLECPKSYDGDSVASEVEVASAMPTAAELAAAMVEVSAGKTAGKSPSNISLNKTVLRDLLDDPTITLHSLTHIPTATQKPLLLPLFSSVKTDITVGTPSPEIVRERARAVSSAVFDFYDHLKSELGDDIFFGLVDSPDYSCPEQTADDAVEFYGQALPPFSLVHPIFKALVHTKALLHTLWEIALWHHADKPELETLKGEMLEVLTKIITYIQNYENVGDAERCGILAELREQLTTDIDDRITAIAEA